MTLAAVVTSAAFRKFSYLPRRMPQIAEVRDAVLSGEICILMWPQAPSAVSMTMVAVVQNSPHLPEIACGRDGPPTMGVSRLSANGRGNECNAAVRSESPAISVLESSGG